MNDDGYYETIRGKYVKLFPVKILDLQLKNIKNLISPKGVKVVQCQHNFIEELIIPEGVEIVQCSFNNIKKNHTSKYSHNTFVFQQ